MRTAFVFIVLALFGAAVLTGCGGDGNGQTDSLAIESTPVEIVRLDSLIEKYAEMDSASRVSVLADNKKQLDYFRQIVSPEIDSVDNSLMMMWSTWPATTAFMPEVNRLYQSMRPEEIGVGEVLARASKENLSFPFDSFVAVTWGNEKSIILVDSTIFLSLNHYLGTLNEAYNGWPEYKRRLKTRDMIQVDVTEAMLATTYPFVEDENTSVLTLLLREGAMAEAKQRLNPRSSLASVLGFTPEQFDEIRQHEGFMWKRLVNDKLLYSTDEEVKSELFDPRPASRILSQDAPGRAARYLGYRIIKNYLAVHPQTSLSTLLSPDFLNDSARVLRESGYNPN